jgi:exopolysaccharide biosynthesis polyprenyl glycosylphosphotransferase
MSALTVVIIPLGMMAARVYESIIDESLFKTFLKTMAVLIACILVISALFFLVETKDLNYLFLLIFIALIPVLFVAGRAVIKICLNLYFMNKKHKVNVLVIGTSFLADQFTNSIKKNKTSMINIIGYINAGEDYSIISGSILGSIENLEKILKNNVVDEVVFAISRDFYGNIQPYIVMCEEMGLTVNMMLDIYDLKVNKTKLGTIGNLPIIKFYTVSDRYWQLLLKRVLDILGAIVGLALMSLAFIFVAPAIYFESPGPIFFSQYRMGKNGRIFKCYKFRSMYIDAEERKKELLKFNEMKGNMFKIKNDPRITKVGKFIRATSIDELPQFWNVFKGDMSLVGTRPPTLDEVEKYKAYHWKRLCIKPGITGLWQVSGRNDLCDFEEIVKLDTKYIENWSIKLDIQLLFRTFKAVLLKSGAA